MDLCDLSPAYVREIAPYQPGKPISELAREMGIAVNEIVKLASNENPLGASPRALAAIQRELSEIARYPDGNGFALKSALASQMGVSTDQIVLGNGSNDVLELVARAFLSPGTSAIYSEFAFAVYALATQGAGAERVQVPAVDFGHNLAAMREAIRDDTRVVFIANPNNPTGTLLSTTALIEFLERVPASVLVVLDEAYREYLRAEDRAPSETWLERFPNLIVCRTFSKAYGLAGLRIGYALASPGVADLMNRVRQPFNANALAQAAATAALDDDEFLRRSFDVNRAGMEQLIQGFKQYGLDYIPSFGNFVSVRIGNATAMYRRLLEQGVIVRPVANYGMPEYLRVSIGLEQENAKFLQALGRAIEEQS